MNVRAALGFVSVATVVTLVASCSSEDPDGSGTGGSAGTGQAGSVAMAGAGGGAAGSGGGASGGSSAGQSGSSTGGGGGSDQGGSSQGGSTSGSGGSGGDSTQGGGATVGGAGAGGGGGAGGGAGGGDTGKSEGCGKAPGIPSNMYNNGKNIPITAANMQRRYVLSVPENYDQNKPYKLVIAWHQRDGNDNQMYANDYYHLKPLSAGSTIFVAPNGQKNGAPCSGTGNGDSNCGWPNTNSSDIALADAVVAEMKANFCIDTNRIFATGWSFGGSMSYATACERPLGGMKDGKAGYTRAIAVYSGSRLSGNCTPTLPVAYYGAHGTKDSVLCYDSMSSGCQVGNGLQLAQDFAKANGCNWMTPTKVTSGNHVCTTLTGCKDGYPEVFCSFNGDHTPDPKDSGQQTSWNYAKVWEFFSQF